MIGFFAARRMNKCLQETIYSMSNSKFQRQEAAGKYFNSIISELDKQNRSLSEVVYSKEGKKIMFQYLLHKHWIAYQAELARQIAAKITPGIHLDNYSELIENTVGKKYMDELLAEFIKEQIPYIRSELKEDAKYNKWNLR